jgi:acetoin utilization protein AcuB
MQDLHVRRYMTASPYTIDRDQAVTDAEALMKKHHIRHLPVVEGTTLVGVVSDLEIAFLVSLLSRMPDRRPIGDFMTPNPYVVTPDTDLQAVAAHLVENKESCAVIVDKARIIGVFTQIDALRALIDLVAKARSIPPSPS